MTVAIGILLLLMAALLQSILPAVSWLASVKPPFLMAVVLFYALIHRRGAFVTVAILAGVVQDSLSLIPAGFSAICFLALGLAIFEGRGILLRDSALTVAALGAVMGGLTTLGLYVLLRFSSGMAAVPVAWLGLKICGSALLGALAAPLVWLLAGSIERHTGVSHREEPVEWC